MQSNTFEGAGPKLSMDDLKNLERKLEVALPSSFIDFYLRFNGGQPTLDWVPGSLRLEPTIVQEFYSINPLGSSQESEDIYSHYERLVKKSLISKNTLPFAVDPGGNFYALDLISKKITYIITEGQFQKREISKSFSEFIQSLTDEDSAYG